MHMYYIVPLLTECMCILSIACLGPYSRMVMGSRTADVLNAQGPAVHFAHKPDPAWTRKDHLQA